MANSAAATMAAAGEPEQGRQTPGEQAPGRGRSLRSRITVGAASVVGLALIIGAFGFAFALNASLTANLHSLAQNDADALAAQIDAQVDVFDTLQALNAAALANNAPDAVDDDNGSNSGTGSGTGSGSGDDADADADSSDGAADDASDDESGDDSSDDATDDSGQNNPTASEAAPAQPSAVPSAAAPSTAASNDPGLTTDLPTTLPTAPPTAPEQLDALLDSDDDRFVQILATDGTVLASEPDDLTTSDGYVSARAETDTTAEGGALTVVAGRSTAQIAETLATVGWLLLVSVPLLVALVALTTWIVVGRALAPVDRMRRELESVTAAELNRRIEQPRSNDEISRLASTMNGMLDRLETSQHSQRRFISDASHELKSPLASLRQYAEVARAYPDRIGATELSDAVLDEGARLEQLVAGMLVLARSDEQALPLKLVDIDLDDVVLSEAKRLRELGQVRVDTSAVAAARVRGDAALLRQLVRNLTDNAARHAASTVTFSLSESPTQVVLVVRDDGDGIDQADRSRVFERFVRLDDARSRASGGSGLGLAIVAEIARAHHGSITVLDARVGSTGAVFELRMPRRDDGD